jgi:hypothetical protein
MAFAIFSCDIAGCSGAYEYFRSAFYVEKRAEAIPNIRWNNR